MNHRAAAELIIASHLKLAQHVLDEELDSIVSAGNALVTGLRNGGTVFVCGNGGSAADAQHFAAELVGRFVIKTRRPLPAIALTTDSSALTAISNDHGYQSVFARQIEALGRPGDVLVGISTSGRSHNVLDAMDKAFAAGLTCIGLVGQDRSPMAAYGRNIVGIPHSETARVQEMHIMVIHTWCEMIDQEFGGAGL